METDRQGLRDVETQAFSKVFKGRACASVGVLLEPEEDGLLQKRDDFVETDVS